MATMRIDEIKAVDRHRKDLGDLSGLAASIRERALLHPPAVTPDGRLIAGQRRLEACRSLGWLEIPVTVISSLTEMRELLEAERDENTERLEMKPSEKVALGRALEALERPAAEARMMAGKRPSENFTEGSRDRSGDTRELVGSAVGMSGPTYQRARTVIERAEEGDPIAIEAARQMDETGKVTPAFEKVTGRSIESQAKQSNHNGTRDGSRRRAPQELLENVLERVGGTVAALDHIDTGAAIATPDVPLTEWDRSLTDIIVPLNRLRGEIRKVLNHE